MRSADPRFRMSRNFLATYPSFWFLRVRWLPGRDALVEWNVGIALLFGSVLIFCAAQDGTLWMNGRATGFFEHPVIFIFLIAHAYVPFAVMRAVAHQVDPRGFSPSALPNTFVEIQVTSTLERFRCSVSRDDNRGQALYVALLTVGAAAFVWNSYQNQVPLKEVGFDFWDSSLHPWGYWGTRVYKFYLWLFLIPSISHLLILSVWSISSIITAVAKQEHGLELDPYHEDGCGGVKLLVDSLLNPLIPVAFIAATLAFAAYFVHGKFDVTTTGGFLLAIAFLMLIYIKPAISLRQTIAREKHRQVSEIKKKQREYYQRLQQQEVSNRDTGPAQAIFTLSEVCKHISNIPDWPQLDRAVKVVTIAGSSPVLAWGVKQIANIAQQYFLRG